MKIVYISSYKKSATQNDVVVIRFYVFVKFGIKKHQTARANYYFNISIFWCLFK